MPGYNTPSVLTLLNVRLSEGEAITGSIFNSMPNNQKLILFIIILSFIGFVYFFLITFLVFLPWRII